MEKALIKILQGVYGYDDGKTIIGKTNADDPFLLDLDKATRLAKLGVAKFVVGDKVITNEDKEEYEDNGNPSDIEKMSLKELKEIAEEYGIKFKVGTSKEAFAAQIKEAMRKEADTENVEGIVEDIPSFDPTEAVQGD